MSGLMEIRALYFIVICTCCYSGPASAGPESDPGHTLAPPFELRDLEGKVHRLSDTRGKVSIINFWATWCEPCREELPSMNRAWASLKDEAVTMMAINVSEDREAVATFRRDYPMDFLILLDTRGTSSQRWGVTGLPTTFVVSPQGRIISRIVGIHQWDSDETLQMIRDLKDRGFPGGKDSPPEITQHGWSVEEVSLAGMPKPSLQGDIYDLFRIRSPIRCE
ncbi:MAG: TlpA family protein disulfide reductase [Gammaproteobacteria bacterium]|nr:TlpA family protein disulfide reductase [Gammaproteobacteria bacterium]